MAGGLARGAGDGFGRRMARHGARGAAIDDPARRRALARHLEHDVLADGPALDRALAASRGKARANHIRSRTDPRRERRAPLRTGVGRRCRSEEHTSELQSLMRISYAVFCLKKKKKKIVR